MNTSTIHSAGDRRKRIPWAATAATVVAAALVLSACSAPADETAPGEAKPTTITIAMASDPTTLTPALTTGQVNLTVAEQITEKLIEFTPDGKSFEPRLATKWEQLDDLTTRLSLREDVKFTNGEAFNATSAQYSLMEVMRNAVAYNAESKIITAVDIVDEYTIDVKSSNVNGLRMIALASSSYQYPMDYYASVGEDGFSNEPIGTGPYVFVEWLKGAQLTFKANVEYWDGEPEIDNVIYKIIPDRSAQIAAVQSGQVDLMTDVPVGAIRTVEETPGLNLVKAPSNRIFYLRLSELTDTPLRNVDVRKALQFAIDRQALIKNQLGGLGTELSGQILVPSYFGFDSSLKPDEYNVEKTKKLLAEAGYPDGFTITFKYSSGRYLQDTELGQAIAAQLALVGITAKQEVLEPGTFIEQLKNLTLNDIALTGSLPSPDGHFMYQQFGEGSPYLYYDNPTINKLLIAESSTADSDERLKIFAQMAQEFRDDPAFVPLFQGADTYLMSDKVMNFTPRASQFVDVRELSIK